MWEDFEFDADKVPTLKLALHIAQIVFALICWILEIIVFLRGTGINGQTGWTFAVCFLSIPAWIYLIGAPRFPRTRHLAEPHVMVTIDSLYTIFWLTAFSTQAAYNTADLCGEACSQSKAIVGLGFFVFLFFCATTFLSIYSLKYYQFHGRLPGYDRIGAQSQNIDPDKAAFSMAPHGSGADDAYAPIRDDDDHHQGHPLDPGRDDIEHAAAGSYGGPTSYGGASQQQSYSSGHGRQTSAYDGRASSPYAGAGGRQSPYDDTYGRPAHQENPFDQGRHENNLFGDHSGYTPPVGAPSPGPGGRPSGANANIYAPPAVHEDYDNGRPLQFPAANYDRTMR